MIRLTMLRTTLIALRGYRGKKVDSKNETTLSDVSYNLTLDPMMDYYSIKIGIIVNTQPHNEGNINPLKI